MWLALATAAAQVTGGDVPELDAQMFRPSLDGRHTLWVDDARRHEDHTVIGRFVVHYTKDPLVYVRPDDSVVRVLSDVVQLDAAAGYQLGPVRAGLVLPVYLHTDGAGRRSEAGFGDLGVDVKATLLDPDDNPAGLAMVGRLGLPTASIRDAPLGADGASWELAAVVDGDIGEKGFVTGNVGMRGVPSVELVNLTWGPRVLARVAAGVRTTDDTGFAGELVTHALPGSRVREGVPVEGLLSGWVRSAKGLKLRGGVGTAFTPGIGGPALRAMFAVSLEPDSDQDTDLDGIVDRDDACPEVPEDIDGVADTDGCPEATKVGVVIEGPDGAVLPKGSFTIVGTELAGGHGDIVELPAGEHTFAVTAPGHVAQEAVRTTAEGPDTQVTFRLERIILPGTLAVKVTGPDGAVLPDATWRIVVKGGDVPEPRDADAAAELMPSSYRLSIEAPGYRPELRNAVVAEGARTDLAVELKPAKAVIEKDRITIQESVFFDLNKATIQPVSFGLLDEVAELLVAHPEIVRLRIEGHTDDQGAADYNKKLSQQRAEAVQTYFVSKGVAAERLEAVGFGEEKPLIPKKTTEARAKNRRVDFFVTERSDE